MIDFQASQMRIARKENDVMHTEEQARRRPGGSQDPHNLFSNDEIDGTCSGTTGISHDHSSIETARGDDGRAPSFTIGRFSGAAAMSNTTP